jgi:DNA-binding transcriptional ArsR family regulator
MSTTASRVVELVKSLPEADQKAIRAALAEPEVNPGTTRRRKLRRLPDGSYLNPNGIPNDDPVFNVLAEIERERHRTPSPSSTATGSG